MPERPTLIRRRSRRPTGRARTFDDLLIADKGPGSVAFRVRTGVYFELDRSATEMVRLVQCCGPAEAVEVLATRHSRPTDEIQADVDRMLHTLEHTSLPTTGAPSAPDGAGGGRCRTEVVTAPVFGQGCYGLRERARRRRRGSSLYRPHRPPEPLARRPSPRLPRSTRISPPFDLLSLSSRERMLLGALASVQRRWLFDATCLRRALAAGWILRRRRPRLCLGLTSAEGALAHAWLVVDGHTIDGLPGAPVFKRLVAPVEAVSGDHV